VTRAFVVLNSDAGRGRTNGFEEALAAHLANHSYVLVETSRREAIGRDVRAAIGRGFDLVLAAGGDGTVSSVADGVAGTGIPLGVIPMGTTNSLANELGIPSDVGSALNLVTGPSVKRRIDGMRVNGRFCLLNVGVGLSPQVMSDAEPEEKHRFGWLAYAAAAAQDVLGSRSSLFDLEVDGERLKVQASEVLVLNSGVLGDPSIRWARGIELDDGRLDLCIVNVRDALDYARVGMRLLFGRPWFDGHPAVRCFPVRRRVRIRTPSPRRVQADGDVIGMTPATVELIPKAIDILVPAARDEQEQNKSRIAAGRRRT
jgi:YegS/Rv2252/BmrU family lipid kinase